MKHVQIWTDGSCVRNPGGRGGWAAVIVCDGGLQEISGGVRSTTNNRMELMAAIMAVKSLPYDSVIEIFTDATYLSDGYNFMLARKLGKLRSGKWSKNIDLWNHLLAVCNGHKPKFYQVRGHHGNPHNERADRLAGLAARVKIEALGIDEGYEKTVVVKNVRPESGSLKHINEPRIGPIVRDRVVKYGKFTRRYPDVRIEQLVLEYDAGDAD